MQFSLKWNTWLNFQITTLNVMCDEVIIYHQVSVVSDYKRIIYHKLNFLFSYLFSSDSKSFIKCFGDVAASFVVMLWSSASSSFCRSFTSLCFFVSSSFSGCFCCDSVHTCGHFLVC